MQFTRIYIYIYITCHTPALHESASVRIFDLQVAGSYLHTYTYTLTSTAPDVLFILQCFKTRMLPARHIVPPRRIIYVQCTEFPTTIYSFSIFSVLKNISYSDKGNRIRLCFIQKTKDNNLFIFYYRWYTNGLVKKKFIIFKT